MIKLQNLLLTIMCLGGMMLFMPDAFAKKKVTLVQQLDNINDPPGQCYVCNDVIKKGEEIELEFGGWYGGLNPSNFVQTNNIEVKVYAFDKNNKQVWVSGVLKAKRAGSMVVFKNTARVFSITFKTTNVPYSTDRPHNFIVKVKEPVSSKGRSRPGQTLASPASYRKIFGHYKFYVQRKVPKNEKRCFRKPNCEEGPTNISAKPNKPINTGKPNSSTLANTKTVFKAYRTTQLSSGKKLLYTDAKSGTKVYATIQKRGSQMLVSAMELKLKNGRVVKLSPRNFKSKNKSRWACNSRWNGTVKGFYHSSKKYSILYSVCGSRLSVQYPYRL
ncbi:MAG: hypothetical protein MRZ79_12820 [Bacteroidia bacterium]|nr:hypothetical protein [Bacteroidia bacterium]